jgi:putative protein kinase ArgK-like GTPase of G3E family
MKCDLKSDHSNMGTLPKEQTQQKYEQIENTKPMVIKTPKRLKSKIMPDPICTQEYINNIDKKCVEDVANEIRSSLSPHCREFVESSQKEEEPYKDCKNEIVMGVNRLFHEVEKCNKLPADSKCRKQIQSAIRVRLWEATKNALNK